MCSAPLDLHVISVSTHTHTQSAHNLGSVISATLSIAARPCAASGAIDIGNKHRNKCCDAHIANIHNPHAEIYIHAYRWACINHFVRCRKFGTDISSAGVCVLLGPALHAVHACVCADLCCLRCPSSAILYTILSYYICIVFKFGIIAALLLFLRIAFFLLHMRAERSDGACAIRNIQPCSLFTLYARTMTNDLCVQRIHISFQPHFQFQYNNK